MNVRLPQPSFERHRRQIAAWLLVLCAMTFAMVILGGLTRLTNSGLSMVHWTFLGSLPPLSEDAWLAEFARYQQFPEYQKINRGMELAEFKRIFWFEYSHRMLGRTIGTVFLLPFLYFLARRAIPRRLALPLVGLFALGGLQGLIGWWMVKSGLVDRPDVSHYRLTVHLGAAFALYCALLWVAVGLLRPHTGPTRHRGLARLVTALAAAVYVTALAGGLVAGSNAGFAFNTFPLMMGELVPPGLLSLSPWWQNLTENLLTMQFQHRLLALATFAGVAGAWAWARRLEVSAGAKRAMNVFFGAALLQVALGITTLLTVVWLPAASLHQAGALALLSAALVAAHALWRPELSAANTKS